MEEEEEETSRGERAQALGALLQARKRRNHTSDHTGGLVALVFSALSQMTAVNYTFVTSCEH